MRREVMRERRIFSQHHLHVNHVEPAVEFEADLPQVRHAFEAEFRVNRDAGLLLAVDAGHDRVMPGARPRSMRSASSRPPMPLRCQV